ncbi:hypothetical protein [Butyrivibrio sp. AE3004]|uniref:hypothetical protein n=1 Tax=Butyrivibrio sp. AE3004 TaxID=1506994 RepID=UPI0004942223|nr:hypothetical protein [Butyrivibrio sp. AE3004]
MELSRVGGKKLTIIAPIILASLSWVMALMLNPLYEDVDNYTISLVTNCLYDSENFCLYLHPILCVMIKVISMFFPTADAYLFLTHILIWIQTAWLLYLSMTSEKDKIHKMVCGSFVLFGTIVLRMYSMNFTVQAASFVFTGWLTLFLGRDRKTKSCIYSIIAGAFIVFGTMWRIQSALIFIPFIILELLAYIYENREITETTKNFWVKFSIFVAIFIALIISQNYVENSAEHVDGLRHDKAIQVLQDFPVYEWKDIEKELEGIDELDYEAALGWFMVDTDRLNPDTLTKMADVAATTRYPINIFGIFTAITIMFKFVYYQSKVVWVVCALVAILFFKILFGELPLVRKIESIFAVLGGFVIILFFTILGRAFLRVWYSVIYAILFILVLQISKINNEKNNEGLYYVFCTMFLGLTLFGIIISCFNINKDDVRNNALTARTNQIDERHLKTCIGDDFYIWEEWGDQIAFYYMGLGVLPSEEFLNHNVDTSTWAYGQKYFINNLSDAGIDNPMKALLERNHTYYVSNDCQFILRYMHKFYGEDIDVVQVGEIDQNPVWQFVRKNQSE